MAVSNIKQIDIKCEDEFKPYREFLEHIYRLMVSDTRITSKGIKIARKGIDKGVSANGEREVNYESSDLSDM